ncbi:MAG: YeeE/YedE thiosulfate transporter family protein [Spirochaetia bacterium]|jgi:uncharacterized membrane protein YedE/YeeE|nr:YeeE/YedE thiosulfate transporter family protein [Spirochaetia bacterium]
MTLFFALLTGGLFGFFLQQTEVIRFEKQVGALKLKDMTIIKFMLTAIVTGSIGIYILSDMGIISFAPRQLSLGLQITGGLLFGAGWAVIGYCPGTSIAAFAEGRFHAIWPIIGMLAGGILYALLYPWIEIYLRYPGELKAVSIPQLLGVSHWIVITVMAIGSYFLFRFFEKKNL